MNILKRLLKIGQAEAHAAVNKMEDPINMSEQAIRDLRGDLEKALEALAQVKALSIRTKNEIEEKTQEAEEYTQKAVLLLKKAQTESLSAEEGDRLAREALIKKEQIHQEVAAAELQKAKVDNDVLKMEGNIATLKQNIQKWENELKTLKARVKVADATKQLNKQMAQLDSHGTVATLERMKDKVLQEEALADAYGDIANSNKSVDDEINKAVNVHASKADNELDLLKKQLGITKDISDNNQ
ncbi:PspA/IM30 family protein [Polluticaenibacter yanchengensis]|uniref:PspA/IM30 family protein n=1 Tax=Polluticaenibacter yanchengensis TaxID=3014562 RepID=A0ABT4UPA0_9BACT|nr:PspA/IM30 family protein [Chitinophagaceae bacterium LY-5]